MKRTLRIFASWITSKLVALLTNRKTQLNSEEWRNVQLSFSQLGEDRLLAHLIAHHVSELPLEQRTYVDVGCFEPVTYSNTLLLYKAGWRGINIDANPDKIKRFLAERPDDISVCAAISNGSKDANYAWYPSTGTNRLVRDDRDRSFTDEEPLTISKVQTQTLNAVLEKFWQPRPFGFLDIDCEGEDLNVLRSLDLARWRPALIAIEAHDEVSRSNITSYAAGHGYELVGRCLVTLIFAKCDQALV